MKEYLDKTGLQDYTTKLKNKFDSRFAPIAAVGSPLVAATAAAMTDQTKVYVYTGSETGYTAGNWYYYNGSAWVSGGIYNSGAVNVDTTLSVAGAAADSKAVGDEFNVVDGEITELKSAIDDYVTDVPAGYTRLEWLQSTVGGNQYCNMGRKLNQGSRIVLTFSCVDLTHTEAQFICGGRDTSSKKCKTLQLSASNQVCAGYNTASAVTGVWISDYLPHTVDYDANNIYLDGTLIKTFTAGTFETPKNGLIFAISANGTTTIFYGECRIYRLKVYESGSLVADYVPVVRDTPASSGRYEGMYDLIAGVFHGNMSETELIRGPVVAIDTNLKHITDLDKRVTQSEKRLDNIAVKDYVQIEADAVADRVRNVQTAYSLSLVAVSDTHYNIDSESLQNGLMDMTQGVKAIKAQVKTDFDVSFGDMIWRLSSDGNFAKGKAEMIGMTKLLAEAFGDDPQIRIVGNHDPNCEGSTGYFTAPQLYGFTGAYSDMLTRRSDSAYSGNGYIDFERQKMRFIVLNTSYYPSTEHPDQGSTYYSFGPAQGQWLAQTLDMSSKSDAQDWQIVIMAHLALDNTAQTNIGKHSAILNAYENGGTWTDGNYSYNFSGKNAAKLALYINGHSHKYMWRNMRNVNSSGTVLNTLKMVDIYVPNALDGREEESIDGVTYTKTAGTAESTAFQIITINPVDKIVYAHHYGAGIDTIMHYDSQAVSSSITLTTNLTSPTWHSNNDETATVSDGTVAPVASGDTMIWAKSETDNCVEAWNLRVTV